MYWIVYLRKGVVYIPTIETVGKTRLGVDSEPVEIANAADLRAVIEAIRRAVARGNQAKVNPHPMILREPWVVLKHARSKSWADFIKGARAWRIETNDEGNYKLSPKMADRKKGWITDETKIETFAAGTSINQIVERLADLIMQENT